MEAEKLIRTKDRESLKNLSELVSLVDGVYDLVFIYKPDGPYNKKWREDWLKKAEKYGASLDY